jgi:hypothetical protein
MRLRKSVYVVCFQEKISIKLARDGLSVAGGMCNMQRTYGGESGLVGELTSAKNVKLIG